MLYFVGLGLADEQDITVRGLAVVRAAARVYLEAYTAVLLVDQAKLEAFYGRPVIVADRETVESSSDDILAHADTEDVAFLVVGDPFGATTHTDLALRARELRIPTQTIHNASILTAVGSTGLSLYNFGQTVSMVFFTDDWKPTSFYDRVAENARLGLHTLVLLDIKVKEPDLKALARGKIVYEAPRYMTVAQAAAQMIESEQIRGGNACRPDALAVGVARLGSPAQAIVAGTLQELAWGDGDRLLGAPLHSLVLIGRRGHELERDYVAAYALDPNAFAAQWDVQYGR